MPRAGELRALPRQFGQVNGHILRQTPGWLPRRTRVAQERLPHLRATGIRCAAIPLILSRKQ